MAAHVRCGVVAIFGHCCGGACSAAWQQSPCHLVTHHPLATHTRTCRTRTRTLLFGRLGSGLVCMFMNPLSPHHEPAIASKAARPSLLPMPPSPPSPRLPSPSSTPASEATRRPSSPHHQHRLRTRLRPHRPALACRVPTPALAWPSSTPAPAASLRRRVAQAAAAAAAPSSAAGRPGWPVAAGRPRAVAHAASRAAGRGARGCPLPAGTRRGMLCGSRRLVAGSPGSALPSPEECRRSCCRCCCRRRRGRGTWTRSMPTSPTRKSR